MQRVGFVAFMMIAMLSVVPVEAQNTKGDGDSERAHDLFVKEKYAAAQFIYDRLASKNPENSDAVYYAAVCSEKLDNDDARWRLEEFLRLYPQSSRCNMARYYLGNYYYTRGEYAEALDYYKLLTVNDVEYGQDRKSVV